MIKKVENIDSLSGVSSPLLPLIYGDFYYKDSESDGVYIQDVCGKKTLVLSIKNNCCYVIKLSEEIDFGELESFFLFSRATSVTSDFTLNNKNEKEFNLLNISNLNFGKHNNIISLSIESDERDYKIIYDLISEGKGGNFPQWYSSFSRKVNLGNAKGVYFKKNNDNVSAAIAPVIYNKTAIVAGVVTKDGYRNLGCATKTIKALLYEINKLDIVGIYLWCEEEKLSFYKKIGFESVGKIYIREEF